VANHFLAALVLIVIALVKRVINPTKPHSEAHTEKSDAINQAETASRDIVKCEQCEVHILKSEAFSVNGQYYCSKAHLPDSASK